MRQIYSGTIGHCISNLPVELGRLNTPDRSPRQRSQFSSATKFRMDIIGRRLFDDENDVIPPGPAILEQQPDMTLAPPQAPPSMAISQRR